MDNAELSVNLNISIIEDETQIKQSQENNNILSNNNNDNQTNGVSQINDLADLKNSPKEFNKSVSKNDDEERVGIKSSSSTSSSSSEATDDSFFKQEQEKLVDNQNNINTNELSFTKNNNSANLLDFTDNNIERKELADENFEKSENIISASPIKAEENQKTWNIELEEAQQVEETKQKEESDSTKLESPKLTLNYFEENLTSWPTETETENERGIDMDYKDLSRKEKDLEYDYLCFQIKKDRLIDLDLCSNETSYQELPSICSKRSLINLDEEGNSNLKNDEVSKNNEVVENRMEKCNVDSTPLVKQSTNNQEPMNSKPQSLLNNSFQSMASETTIDSLARKVQNLIGPVDYKRSSCYSSVPSSYSTSSYRSSVKFSSINYDSIYKELDNIQENLRNQRKLSDLDRLSHPFRTIPESQSILDKDDSLSNKYKTYSTLESVRSATKLPSDIPPPITPTSSISTATKVTPISSLASNSMSSFGDCSKHNFSYLNKEILANDERVGGSRSPDQISSMRNKTPISFQNKYDDYQTNYTSSLVNNRSFELKIKDEINSLTNNTNLPRGSDELTLDLDGYRTKTSLSTNGNRLLDLSDESILHKYHQTSSSGEGGTPFLAANSSAKIKNYMNSSLNRINNLTNFPISSSNLINSGGERQTAKSAFESDPDLIMQEKKHTLLSNHQTNPIGKTSELAYVSSFNPDCYHLSSLLNETSTAADKTKSKLNELNAKTKQPIYRSNYEKSDTSTASNCETIESTHSGSDDARGPVFPYDAYGSRPNDLTSQPNLSFQSNSQLKSLNGIYNKREQHQQKMKKPDDGTDDVPSPVKTEFEKKTEQKKQEEEFLLNNEYLKAMDKKLKKLIKKNLNRDILVSSERLKSSSKSTNCNNREKISNALAWEIPSVESKQQTNDIGNESLISTSSTTQSSNIPTHPYLPLRDVPMHDLVKKLQREFETEANLNNMTSDMNEIWINLKCQINTPSLKSKAPDEAESLTNLIKNPIKTIIECSSQNEINQNEEDILGLSRVNSKNGKKIEIFVDRENKSNKINKNTSNNNNSNNNQNRNGKNLQNLIDHSSNKSPSLNEYKEYVASSTESKDQLDKSNRNKNFLNELPLRLDNYKHLRKEKLQEIIQMQKEQHERRIKALEKLAKLERIQAEKLKKIMTFNQNDSISSLIYDSFFNNWSFKEGVANELTIDNNNNDSSIDIQSFGDDTTIDDEKFYLESAPAQPPPPVTTKSSNLKQNSKAIEKYEPKNLKTKKKLKFKDEEENEETEQEEYPKYDDETIPSDIENSYLSLPNDKDTDESDSKVEVFNLNNTSVYEPLEGVMVVKEYLQPKSDISRRSKSVTNQLLNVDRPIFSVKTAGSNNSQNSRNMAQNCENANSCFNRSSKSNQPNEKRFNKKPLFWTYYLTGNSDETTTDSKTKNYELPKSRSNVRFKKSFKRYDSSNIGELTATAAPAATASKENIYEMQNSKKLSLQEAFETYRYDLISRSRQRQREIKFRAEQRFKDAELERERLIDLEKNSNNFSLKKSRSIMQSLKTPKNEAFEINIENFMHRRHMTLQEIRDQTKKIYKKLPEVQQKQLKQRAEENKRRNRIKSKIYKKV